MMTRMIVALYDRVESAEAAIDELVQAGIDRRALKLTAPSDIKRLESGRPRADSIEASSFLVGRGVPDDRAEDYARLLGRGAALVSVPATGTTTETMTAVVSAVLKRHGPIGHEVIGEQVFAEEVALHGSPARA